MRSLIRKLRLTRELVDACSSTTCRNPLRASLSSISQSSIVPSTPARLLRRHRPRSSTITDGSILNVERQGCLFLPGPDSRHMTSAPCAKTKHRLDAGEPGKATHGEDLTKQGCGIDSMASLQELLGMKDSEAAKLRGDVGAASALSGPCWSRLVAAGGGRQSLAWFLVDQLGADPNKVRAAALRNPAALLGKSSTAAGEVSRHLQEALGMDRAAVARVVLRFPPCAHLSLETLEAKIRWLRDNICVDNATVVRIINLTPQLLGRSVEEALEPQFLWLQTRFGLSASRAANVLRTVPVLFTCCPKKNLEPLTHWLKERIGLDDNDVAAMITSAPTILTMNPTTGIEPKLAWLRDSVGVTEDETRRLVRSCPAILKRSVERSLEPKLAWLRETLGLSRSEVKSLLLRCPTVMGASLDGNLRLKLPWLTGKVGLTREEAVGLMSRNPTLMLLSIDKNLEPTLAFYQEYMGASTGELREVMLQNPRLLATSLQGRLMPRAAAMRALGIKLKFMEHHSHVGVLSDAKFYAYVEHHGMRELGGL